MPSTKHNAGVLTPENDLFFAEIASYLSEELCIPIVHSPVEFNYVIGYEPLEPLTSYVPIQGIKAAEDKRIQARLFKANNVPTPETHLVYNAVQLCTLLSDTSQPWALKYPTSCGGYGHRLIDRKMDIPNDWPLPLIVQAFIEMDEPQVFRLFSINGHTFGWNVRKYADNEDSPWVSHARGASYELCGDVPTAALDVAQLALKSCHLDTSIGSVDMIFNQEEDRWLALEVGTDGTHSYIDRDLPPELSEELSTKLRKDFWSKLDSNRSNPVHKP